MNNKQASDILDELWGNLSRKVVIIDDDPDIVKIVKADLAGEFPQIDCAEAYDGEGGLEVIEREYPDLVILDIKMPGISGLELLKEIRAHNNKLISKIPVLMLTAKNDLDTVKEAVQIGADNYLVKPYERNELYSRIKNLLAF